MDNMTETIKNLIAESQDRLKTRTYDENGNLITEWNEEKGCFEDGTEQLETGEWIMTRIFHPYTENQLTEKEIEKEKAALEESRRQFTFKEVAALFIINQVNTVDIPDQTSLRMIDYYPKFEDIIGQTVKMGFKFVYNNKLYKTIQDNLLIQSHYIPDVGTESLYSRIDVEHTGTIIDPIPYDGNMELFEGKYYIQNGITYLCTRSSGVALYHALSDLIDLYVKLA